MSGSGETAAVARKKRPGVNTIWSTRQRQPAAPKAEPATEAVASGSPAKPIQQPLCTTAVTWATVRDKLERRMKMRIAEDDPLAIQAHLLEIVMEENLDALLAGAGEKLKTLAMEYRQTAAQFDKGREIEFRDQAMAFGVKLRTLLEQDASRETAALVEKTEELQGAIKQVKAIADQLGTTSLFGRVQFVLVGIMLSGLMVLLGIWVEKVAKVM